MLWAWNGLPLNTYITMYTRTDAIPNEVLEPNTFVLAYPTVYDSQNKSSYFPDSINWFVIVVERSTFSVRNKLNFYKYFRLSPVFHGHIMVQVVSH